MKYEFDVVRMSWLYKQYTYIVGKHVLLSCTASI